MFRHQTRLETWSFAFSLVGSSIIVIVMLSGGMGRPALGYGILAASTASMAGMLAAMATGGAARRTLIGLQIAGLVVMTIALVAFFRAFP